MRRSLLLTLVVLAVLLAVNTVVTDSETKPAEADAGRIVELPGTDLQVRERGPVNAPAILLVHCYTCSIHWWQRLEPLLARDHRVISVDLPGHGGSEKPQDGYEIAEQADQVAAALREVGATNVLAVGQSLGGAVVTALVERHRPMVRGVVVMDSGPSPDFGNLPVTAKIARAPVIGEALKRVTPGFMIRNELGKAFAEGFDVPDQFVEDVRRMTYTSFKEAISSDYSEERSLPDRLTSARRPVLVIFGAEDRIVKPGAADEYRDIPHGRVVVLPGVGHTPQMEAPAKSAALIRDLDRSTRQD
jgi:pimeloyl-ACP methyl ester carboxylesterase